MRILVADDSATHRAMAELFLGGNGYEIVSARDGEEALRELLKPGAPRLALLDWEMPTLDGPEVCRRVREKEARGTAYTYMVLVTAREEKTDVIAGMDAGADDYVVKPFDQHELIARLRAGRRILDLQRALVRLKTQFRTQARTDPLTRCLNLRAVMERLAGELGRARRSGGSVGVGVLDIDFFKRINDAHGHAAGDAVLRRLVRRMNECIRISDFFGRIGGEEFLVVWPATESAGVKTGAERLRAEIARAPFAVPGAEIKVSVSIGATTTMGGEPAEAVIARADAALYAAKQAGRNRVETATAPPSP